MTTRAARERRLVGALSLALLALGGTVGAILWAERRAADDAAATRIVAERVARIALERPGREDIALERLPDGDWRVVAPCAIDANDARIDPLLGALAGAGLDYAAGDVDLEAAGLLAPRAIVRLDGTPIALGDTDLGGERRYASRGERVALVPEWTLSLVDGGLSALAETAPFPTAPTLIRRLGAAGTNALDPAPWGALAASQVVAWPVPDAPEETRRARFEATFASGGTRVVELVGNASWNALLSPDGECAWLFADADLPPGAYR